MPAEDPIRKENKDFMQYDTQYYIYERLKVFYKL